jgi:hypothetical protein
MNGFLLSFKKKNRKNVIFFRKGYLEGVLSERERIVEELLQDAVVITNLDVKILERVVEIVEG